MLSMHIFTVSLHTLFQSLSLYLTAIDRVHAPPVVQSAVVQQDAFSQDRTRPKAVT